VSEHGSVVGGGERGARRSASHAQLGGAAVVGARVHCVRDEVGGALRRAQQPTSAEPRIRARRRTRGGSSRSSVVPEAQPALQPGLHPGQAELLQEIVLPHQPRQLPQIVLP